MNDKPVLLIDVDGVLNPFNGNPVKLAQKGYQTHWVEVPDKHYEKLHTYKVYLNPDDGKRLLSLSDKYELVWATTWENNANNLLSPLLGLPKLPYVDFGENRSVTGLKYWKTPVIKDYFSDGGPFAGRRFVWLDDETTQTDRRYFDDMFSPGFHKLVFTHSGQGLTESHYKQLEDWGNTL